jgi:NAD+ synthase (glutamine-hydrolysing)
MNYGFVKVAAAVPRVKVADCKFNSERLEGLITIAEGKGVQILTFPEMCITGYTCGDLFAQQLLLEQAEMALIQILNSTRQLDIISILGMPVVVNSTVINAAVVIQKGKILGVVPKTYLPNYKEFYEQRWFTSSRDIKAQETVILGQLVPLGADLLFKAEETTFGTEICEDLWVAQPPAAAAAAAGANVIVNLSASNEIAGKAKFRRELVRLQSARSMCAYVYASSGEGESTTDLVFSGHLLAAAGGRIAAESIWQTGMISANIDLERIELERIRFRSFAQGVEAKPCRRIHAAPTPSARSALWPAKVDPAPFIPKNAIAPSAPRTACAKFPWRALVGDQRF